MACKGVEGYGETLIDASFQRACIFLEQKKIGRNAPTMEKVVIMTAVYIPG